eukprot:gnl/TRDRNA2_/TRDRNA2_102139_c2_seq1.p1 gnl/TRDRNA2_/TRDRNA2_102139_c2~~gnl/TRDRNA2_/TRDRNA2_102139_c2_seq1.p1  ORF type:complete len:258 (+),score=22.83 gnl/TRDRNA2_/TRDRNA2_102139_c2_seq1:2-775(+)
MWPDIPEWLPHALQHHDGLLMRGYFEIFEGKLTESRPLAPALPPGTLPPNVEAELRNAVATTGLAFSCQFYGSMSEFNQAWVWTWALLGAHRNRRATQGPRRSHSTADTANRVRDKQRVEATWGLAEFGDEHVELRDRLGSTVAHGFHAVVYGDHGPYLEFLESQICWPTFTQHVLKGPGRTHFEHYNSDGSVKLYDQFKAVVDQPNPPSGACAACNNRTDGYADYQVGCIYIACEDFFADGGRVLPAPASGPALPV